MQGSFTVFLDRYSWTRSVFSYFIFQMSFYIFLDFQIFFYFQDENGEKAYKCQLCPMIFKSYPKITEHIAEDHQGKREYSCRFCKKIFTRSDGKLRHERFSCLKGSILKGKPKVFFLASCSQLKYILESRPSISMFIPRTFLQQLFQILLWLIFLRMRLNWHFSEHLSYFENIIGLLRI